jgi:hypothetical protein
VPLVLHELALHVIVVELAVEDGDQFGDVSELLEIGDGGV